MKLYHTPFSSPSRSVLMTIRCLKLDEEVEVQIVDSLKGENKTPQFLKLNPLGKVPVLVDGEVILTESRAIMTYLVNSRRPGSSFYPSDNRQRAIVDSRLYCEAGGLFVQLYAAFAPIVHNRMKEIPNEIREKLKQSLKHLDNFLEGKAYFAGDEATLADISILSSIVQLRNGFNGEENLPELPNINAWYERCSTLPGYKENLKAGKLISKIFEKHSVRLEALK